MVIFWDFRENLIWKVYELWGCIDVKWIEKKKEENKLVRVKDRERYEWELWREESVEIEY